MQVCSVIALALVVEKLGHACYEAQEPRKSFRMSRLTVGSVFVLGHSDSLVSSGAKLG